MPMSHNTGVLSPDGTQRWDGAAWQPVSRTAQAQAQTSITVGSRSAVGVIRLDPKRMHGERIGGHAVTRVQSLQYGTGYQHMALAEEKTGGRPHLVIPIEILMQPRPAYSTLALVSLDVTLTLASGETTWRCLPLDLIAGMPCRSIATGPMRAALDLQYAFGPADISAIERARQQSIGSTPDRKNDSFRLVLGFSGRVAALTTAGEDEPQRNPSIDPFEYELGPRSQLAYFWDTHIAATSFELDHDAWTSTVIPTFKAILRRGR